MPSPTPSACYRNYILECDFSSQINYQPLRIEHKSMDLTLDYRWTIAGGGNSVKVNCRNQPPEVHKRKYHESEVHIIFVSISNTQKLILLMLVPSGLLWDFTGCSHCAGGRGAQVSCWTLRSKDVKPGASAPTGEGKPFSTIVLCLVGWEESLMIPVIKLVVLDWLQEAAQQDMKNQMGVLKTEIESLQVIFLSFSTFR